MKLNLLKSVLVLLTFTSLSSCVATHMGTMSGSAALNSPNFTYKNHDISGEASANYILGIGGEARQSLVAEAKKNMLEENPLLKNQALANVSVSYKTSSLLGFLSSTVKCVVTADIVEFIPSQTDLIQTDISQSQALVTVVPKDNSIPTEVKSDNIAKTTEKPPTVKQNVNKNKEVVDLSALKVGDEVKIVNYFSEPVDGKIIEIRKEDYVVEYKNSKNVIKQAKVISAQLVKFK